MSSESGSNGNSPAEIEADIARQREQLADTVDALQSKLDVKAHAKDKAAELKDQATTDSGKPRPVVVAGAVAVLAAIGAYVVFRVRRKR